MLQMYEAYPAGFEAAFGVDSDDSTKLKISDTTEEWYNSQIDLIHMIIGFKPQPLCLSGPQRDAQLIRAYTFGYIVYRKLCNLLSRPSAREPLLSP